ncbi:hypothetical protein HYQ45_004764 [Verticillium longisporum]|uniref:Uncharacterized protein n=1 Tax=Verticillium longisporum TaxID=100787 RepID=A0A8I3AT19_VERLO|nr:hypothetical protein HYQ44_008532 [Verticillium longisporum]KAG7138028.1 hypothetical protein HYQ45_004764 [Verticillium longisporum]
MRHSTLLGLPTSLLLLITSQAQSQQARQPIAIRKLPLAASEKLLPEHFAFAGSPAIDTDKAPPFLSPREAVLADRLQLSVDEEQLIALNASDASSRPYRPAFKSHEEEGRRDGWDWLRRAAEVLNVLEGRQTCPGGMEDCSNVGAPNKCCMSGEVTRRRMLYPWVRLSRCRMRSKPSTSDYKHNPKADNDHNNINNRGRRGRAYDDCFHSGHYRNARSRDGYANEHQHLDTHAFNYDR